MFVGVSLRIWWPTLCQGSPPPRRSTCSSRSLFDEAEHPITRTYSAKIVGWNGIIGFRYQLDSNAT